MLSDFFRINLPYGMVRNEQGGWMAFNREYKPIGFNTEDATNYAAYPVFTIYKRLPERLIMELVGNDEKAVNRDKDGEIRRFWLYSDSTNPMNQSKPNNEFWELYWKKLEKLSRLGVKRDIDEIP